jgi:hypothetical protein
MFCICPASAPSWTWTLAAWWRGPPARPSLPQRAAAYSRPQRQRTRLTSSCSLAASADIGAALARELRSIASYAQQTKNLEDSAALPAHLLTGGTAIGGLNRATPPPPPPPPGTLVQARPRMSPSCASSASLAASQESASAGSLPWAREVCAWPIKNGQRPPAARIDSKVT